MKRLGVFLLALSALVPAEATITRVQSKHTYPATSGSGVAFTSNNTAGNLLIVSVKGTNSTAYAISDTIGNSWSSFAFHGGGNGTTNLDTMKIFYVLSCLGGANTVTITDTAGNDMGFTMLEYSTSGGATWSVDSSLSSGLFTNGTGAGTTAQVSTAFSTAGSDDLIYVSQSDEANTQATHTTTPAGLSEIQWDNGHVDGDAEWLDATAQTNITPGWNVATAQQTWCLYAGAFTASSSMPPVITPSIPTVYVSSCIAVASDQSVTFTLASGSTGTLSGATVGVTTVTFCGPGPVVPHNIWLGNPLLPNDHVYNTRADNLPTQVSTNTYFHSQVIGVHVGFEVDMPENRYLESTSSTNLVFNYTPAANGFYKLLPFPDMRVENGLFSDFNQVDQHIMGANTDTGEFSEFYKLYPKTTNSTCLTCNSQSGVKYSDNYTLSQGVDAAGMYISPLVLRYSEMKDCVDKGIPIKHALRFTLSQGRLAPANIWPAVAFATDGGSIPFGARFVLLSTFTLTGTAGAQCVESALKNNGMFITDGGNNMAIQVMQDVVADYSMFGVFTNELPNLAGLTSDNFRAVDESTLEDLDSTSPTYQKGRVDPANAYETPDNYATIIASNTTTHLVSKMPVIVQPVTIGASQITGYSFMAGTPAKQLDLWVRGSTDTTMSCSMSPTLGSLTSAGIYTAPATVVNRSSTSVTCTPTMDTSQSISFPVVVYSTDGIRERLSNAVNVDYGPDTNGKTWFTDFASLYRFRGSANCDWSGDAWSGVTDAGLYKHCEYINSGSGDQYYRFIVPNGNYRIKLLYGIGGSSAFASGTWQEAIDAQGTVFSSSPSTTTLTGDGPWTELGVTGKYFDLCTLISGCAQQTPATITINTSTSDNNLYFAIRHLAPVSVTQPASVLTAFSIEPVVSSSTISQIFRGNIKRRGGARYR